MKTWNEDQGGEPKRIRTLKPWILGGAVIAMVFVIAVATAMLAGWGRDSGANRSASGVAEPSLAGESAQAVAVPAAGPATAAGSIPATDGGAAKSLPPDLEVSEMDTLVTPGEAVEFVVQGTPDVTEMALSDGRGDPLPLVHDQGADTWRVTYRVPLRPRYERYGVSITAKNEASRWRRTWVFLHVSAADSTEATPAPVDNPDEEIHQ
jgi:hypothetical protein